MAFALINAAARFPRRMLADRLARNIGWLAAAELISRVGRIAAAVVVARQLDAAAFGVAAIALTVFELVRSLTENGIGAAVIRASAEDVDKIANSAYRLMWRVCLALAVVQLGIAAIVDTAMPTRGLGLMIASLSAVYLIMPLGLLHAYMLMREQRMKRLAKVGSGQAVADHLLTAALALFGLGAWAMVLPKLLTAPIWLVGVRLGSPWRRDKSAGLAPAREMLRFSLAVLAAELVNTVRDQFDKVIVSATLGVEAVGLYYFAFNAGLGVSAALNRAFANALYPHLCAASHFASAFRNAMLRLASPLTLAYLAQAAAALIYVPIVFGAAWAHAAPLVATLCLGGPARLAFDGARMHARAEGRTRRELVLSLGFAISALTPFAVACSLGLQTGAALSVAGATAFSAAAMIAAFRAPLTRSACVAKGAV